MTKTARTAILLLCMLLVGLPRVEAQEKPTDAERPTDAIGSDEGTQSAGAAETAEDPQSAGKPATPEPPPLPEVDDTADREEAEFLIQGVLHRIERIRTGDVTIQSFGIDPDNEKRLPGSTIRMAFDHDTDCVHYDHAHRAGGGFRTVRFIRSESQCIQHVEKSYPQQTISLHPPDFVPAIPQARPIDLRTVGLVGDGELSMNATLDFVKTSFWINLSLFHTVSVERGMGEGLVLLRLDHRDVRGADWRVEVLIDEQRQYVPVELRKFYRSVVEEELRHLKTDRPDDVAGGQRDSGAGDVGSGTGRSVAAAL